MYVYSIIRNVASKKFVAGILKRAGVGGERQRIYAEKVIQFCFYSCP